MNISDLRIDDYTYNLPKERIAKFPCPQRDKSKLLVYRNQEISEDTFENVTNYLPNNSLLVFNNTRVIHARLKFRKQTGAEIEVFCLEPSKPSDYQQCFAQTADCEWICYIGNLKRWKNDILKITFSVQNHEYQLSAQLIDNVGDAFRVRFQWLCLSDSNLKIAFVEVLENVGFVPLPPYINRNTVETDSERYQTVYSRIEGSVAAPTAGLHFTPEVFNKLKIKNIITSELTLHVGAGTFKPVTSDKIADHVMHTEHFFVRKHELMKLIDNVDNTTAVGTTSLRTLESLYWFGVKLLRIENYKNEEFILNQWDAYQLPQEVETKMAFQEVYNYLQNNGLDTFSAATQLLIVPSYKIRTAKTLITNFHQPESTLLLLVSAFIGSAWREIYDYALANNFRFLSYGDSSVLQVK